MMKISITYRFIASLLSFTIALSVVSPALGFAGMMEHCAEMMEMNESSHLQEHSMSDMNHIDMPMDGCCTFDAVPLAQPAIDHCEISIDCNCEIDANGVENIAVVVQQIKFQQVSSEFQTLPVSEELNQRIPPPLWYSNSYTPPQLFLSNESLLI